MVLKDLILAVSTLGRYGDPERTDILQFLIWEVWWSCNN